MTRLETDVLIIGAGPGGCAAALQASECGFKVCLIDERPLPGGHDLYLDATPLAVFLHITRSLAYAQQEFSSMGLLYQGLQHDLKKMRQYKDMIVDDMAHQLSSRLRMQNIQYISGKNEIVAPGHIRVTSEDTTTTYECFSPRIILALEPIPSSPTWVVEAEKPSEHPIFNPHNILDMTSIPRHMTLLGNDDMGLEAACIWSRLGASVTVIRENLEHDDDSHNWDHDIMAALTSSLTQQELSFRLARKVLRVYPREKLLSIHLDLHDMAKEKEEDKIPDIIQTKAILLAYGWDALTDRPDLKRLGIDHDLHGKIKVNENYETGCSGIFALGDTISGPKSSQRAIQEGISIVNQWSNKKTTVDYHLIPRVLKIFPEASQVGFTEERLIHHKIPYVKSIIPMHESLYAHMFHSKEGFLKILSHLKTQEVLGISSFYAKAIPLIEQAAMMMRYGTTKEEVIRAANEF